MEHPSCSTSAEQPGVGAGVLLRALEPLDGIEHEGLDFNRRTDADPAYEPFIVTPCFPSCPSADASASYSAREILTRTFGNRRDSIALSNPAWPGFVLYYNASSEITDDIDNARVYGRYTSVTTRRRVEYKARTLADTFTEKSFAI